ncbi:hypothetical protein B0J17DRAFT_637846 [Rhizoctonia solani]|nr:hypothetical protein B0J17DRAFT_637846 [Rhizoctonia solani]
MKIKGPLMLAATVHRVLCHGGLFLYRKFGNKGYDASSTVPYLVRAMRNSWRG